MRNTNLGAQFAVLQNDSSTDIFDIEADRMVLSFAEKLSCVHLLRPSATERHLVCDSKIYSWPELELVQDLRPWGQCASLLRNLMLRSGEFPPISQALQLGDMVMFAEKFQPRLSLWRWIPDLKKYAVEIP
jgi:hypothetical protein